MVTATIESIGLPFEGFDFSRTTEALITNTRAFVRLIGAAQPAADLLEPLDGGFHGTVHAPSEARPVV